MPGKAVSPFSSAGRPAIGAVEARRSTPGVTDLPHPLAAMVPYVQDYGYAAVFLGLLLESVGLPLPGETMLIAGAALAAKGDLQIVPLLAWAWLGAVLGYNLGFGIGRFGGRRLIVRYGARIGITSNRLDQAQRFYDRFGGEVVLIARFFVLARQLNGILAGAVGMNWWRFLAYNAIGAALWVGAWGIGVYTVGEELGSLAPWIHRFGYAAIGVGAIVAIGAIILHWRRTAGDAGHR
jgi:membrane protein DedA with SNARE-associated domain